MEKLAYTVNEVMKELGIGRSKLYAEIKAGRLRACKAGKRTLFRGEDVKAYLENLPEYRA